jgi:hypothetical protein
VKIVTEIRAVCHKPRNTKGDQEPPEAERARQDPPLEPPEKVSLPKFLTSDFRPLELERNEFLCLLF